MGDGWGSPLGGSSLLLGGSNGLSARPFWAVAKSVGLVLACLPRSLLFFTFALNFLKITEKSPEAWI